MAEQFEIGPAYGSILLDASGVAAGIRAAKSSLDGGLSGLATSLDSIGEKVSNLGGALTKLTAPAGLALGFAIKSAMDFDEAMTNVGTVLGKNHEQMKDLTATILEFSSHTRAGPQAVADAFYDIVGGVADASTHMAILEAAVKTAEAGNADLKGTTKALISTMNSYAFTADKASFASDVLTQIVNKGVGSMDEFAGALPNVTGLAHTLGIGLDDLGAQLAFITTKGFSASEAATQLRSMMIALIKPNDTMQKALKEAGFASAEQALKMHGLAGTYELLRTKSKTFQDDMAGAVGRVEALNGTLALSGADAKKFLDSFGDGLQGITDRSQALQNASPAAQFDMLKANISGTAIELSKFLLPAINDLIAQVNPLLDKIASWANANPELTKGILLVVGAAALLGPILIGVGMAFSAIGTIVGVLSAPLLLLVGLAVALGVAWSTNFLGIRDITTQIFTAVVQFVQTTVIPGIQQLFVFLATAWANIQPYLNELWVWFTQTALPAVVNFVQTTVVPIINDLVSVLQTIWQIVGPPLGELFNWFTGPGLPVIKNIVEQFWHVVLEPLINTMAGMWNAVRDSLHSFAQWFKDNIDPIRQFVQGLVRDLENLINMASRALDSLRGIQNNATVIQQGLNSGQFNLGDVFKATVNAIGQEFGHHANAGTLTPGWNMLGENGAELVYARGGEQSYSAAQTQSMTGAQQPLVGQVVIYANSKAEGAAAAEGFAERLEALHRRRG